METTSQFLDWYFNGLGGFGGWALFAISAILSISFLIIYSQTRKLPVVGWLVGAVVAALMLSPSMLYAFGDSAQWEDLKEVFFYLGLLGGLLPIVAAVGYFVTYQGYDPTLPEVPEYDFPDLPPPPLPPVSPPSAPAFPPPPPPVAVPPPLPKGNSMADTVLPGPPKVKIPGVFLLDRERGKEYPLYEGETSIGRKQGANDLVLKNDKAISRQHCKIKEYHGTFTLYDLGAKTGTQLNGKRIRTPRVLHDNDEILIGDTQLEVVLPKR